LENVLCNHERCAPAADDGTFALFALVPGSYELSAGAAGHIPEAYPKALHVDARSQYAGVDFRLAHGGVRVRGSIRDATGGVVVGALVMQVRADAGQARARTLSNSEGEFELAAAAGPVMLMASAEGYASTRRAVGAPATDVTLTLTPEARIKGVVLERKSQRPLAGVVVEAEGASSEVSAEFASVHSDDEGRFLFTGLPPGNYRLQGASDEFRVTPAVDVSLALTDVLPDVVLEAEASHALQGELLMRDGKRCASWGRVSLAAEHITFGSDRPTSLVEAMARVPPGELVRLRGIRPGSYRVRAACGNYPLADGPTQLEVTDAPLTMVRWHFEDAARVLVRARDASGKAIRELPLQLAQKDTPGQPISGAETNVEGLAEFEGVQPGDYVVQAPLLHGQPAVEVRIPKQQKEVNAELVVKGSTTLRVHVVTERGVPFATGTVIVEEHLSPEEAKQRPPNAQQALALGDGVYEFHPIAAGAYNVTVLDDLNPPVRGLGAGAEEHGPNIVLRAGEPLEIKLTYGGYDAQLHGRVVDAQGAGVANAWVEATAVGRKAMYLPPATKPRVYTDEEGKFTIESVRRDASYDLQVGGPDGSGAAQANVSPSQQPKIVLPLSARLSGTLTDPEGKALPEFAVQVDSLDSGSSRAVMFRGTKGKWTVQGIAPGRVVLHAGTPAKRVRETLTLAPGEQRTNLALVLAQGPASAP
jgi:protocatechuate 3,4-dioxygenase beta subunit